VRVGADWGEKEEKREREREENEDRRRRADSFLKRGGRRQVELRENFLLAFHVMFLFCRPIVSEM